MPLRFNLSKQDANDNPRIVSKRYLYNDELYDILKYDKDVLTHDDYNVTGRYRSVIFKGHRLVTVAPSKSMQFSAFTEKYPFSSAIISEELVEGTMVNLFFNPEVSVNGNVVRDKNGELKGQIDIATRSTVGANVSFYQDDAAPSFRHMFLEACGDIDFDFDHLKMSDSDGSYCYSFVLQHPANRIVKPIHKANVYLADIYRIESPDECVENHEYKVTKVDYRSNEIKTYLGLDKCNLSYPEQVKYDSYEQAKGRYNDMSVDYSIPGVVFYNKDTGDRCKYRNKSYEEVRFLRGNQPRLQYQYLILRQKGTVKDFLKYYPEKAKECESYRRLVHNFTKSLHTHYRACYVNKEKPLLEFPEQHRTHMYNLHQVYIKDYREKKGYIGMPAVIKYVNEMPVSHLMHAVNLNLKKRHVANIANELEKNSDSK